MFVELIIQTEKENSEVVIVNISLLHQSAQGKYYSPLYTYSGTSDSELPNSEKTLIMNLFLCIPMHTLQFVPINNTHCA